LHCGDADARHQVKKELNDARMARGSFGTWHAAALPRAKKKFK